MQGLPRGHRPRTRGAHGVLNLGNMLNSSGHKVEAKERAQVGSEFWARITSAAFDMLKLEACDEVAKPEWWDDEGLKVLSARVVKTVPNQVCANFMRAEVLCGMCGAWEVGPRSAADLKEAAVSYERAAVKHNAPAQKAGFARNAELCRMWAEGM